MDQSGQQDSAAVTDMNMTTLPGETPSDWSGRFDFPLDPNLWMQLDSFPFSKSSGISEVCNPMLTPVADTNFLG